MSARRGALLGAADWRRSHEFPRLGGSLIGDPHNYDDSGYQAEIAQLDLAILGMYNGWNGGDYATSVNAIRAINPNILLGNYTIMTEVPSDSSNAATATRWTKLGAETGPGSVGDWWARDHLGAHTDWTGNAGAYTWDTNLTLNVTADANGDKYPQYAAKLDHTQILDGVAWDIWYCDNNMWKPRDDPDWNRDGTNDSQNNTTVRGWWRDGQRAYYDEAKSLAPGLQLMVNADSDLDGGVFPSGADSFSQYKHVVHSAFIERAMGESWSVEDWGGWSTMMGWYRALKANLIGPQLVVFQIGMANTGQSTDYQYLRYAMGSCLMDDGYFVADIDQNQIPWFDEYDLAGTSTTKWLGVAMQPPQTSAWQSGVYRRNFEGGCVLVNPKGNGSKTVTVGAGYKRFSGSQDSTTNNGATVTSTVTLADRDGLFLVKA